jgi:hypothetical protein
VLRRGVGTGFRSTNPHNTACSNNPRADAIRRFIVAADAPGFAANGTTLHPFVADG